MPRISCFVRTVWESIRLIRIINCFMAALGVWVGARLTPAEWALYDTTMAALAAFLVCAGGNIVNDLIDIEIDRINRPDRVLVRGALSRGYAVGLAIAISTFGIVVAATVNWAVTTVVIVAIALLMVYNFYLKKTVLAGNSLVALLGALTFITGGLAADIEATWRLPGPIIPAVFAFLFHLVREIVKDVEDILGDSRQGVVTLPQVLGLRSALGLALALFAVLALLTTVPIAADWFGRWYSIITVYFVDLPLAALLIAVWFRPHPGWLRLTSTALKVGMALGVAALMAG